MSMTAMPVSIVCTVWWLRSLKSGPRVQNSKLVQLRSGLPPQQDFFSPLILVSAFRPLLMLGMIHDTLAFFLHTEDTAFHKAQLGRLWQAMLLHAPPLSFTPLSSSHFLPISLYRVRVGWGTMTPSLPLPTSPHGVKFGWGTMSLVCMLTLGIWDARMFHQESHLYSVLKLLYLKGD